MWALGSAKSSPGVTTAALALVAAWPADRPVVVAELDPDGGDLAARLGVAGEPGLVSLAAEARREMTADAVQRHTQPLPGVAGARLLAGPASAEQARAALATLLRAGLAERLADRTGMDIVVDCGRLTAGSPLVGLAARGRAVVLVARPAVAEVAHLRARVVVLRPAQPLLLLVGDRPYSSQEVAEAAGAPVVGVLSEDRRGAAALNGAGLAGARRSRLVRSAAVVARRLADLPVAGGQAHSDRTAAAGLAGRR